MAVNNSLNNTANSFSTTAGFTVGNALTVSAGGINSTGAISMTGGNVSLATDAVAHTVTIGNTTGASALVLKTGTADMSLASATGTIMSALDTGEITYPLQPAFLAIVGSDITNVTGDGTVYTIIFGVEAFDQNSDFNTTTGTFTAPVTGRYRVTTEVWAADTSTHNDGVVNIVTSNRTIRVYRFSPTAIKFPAADTVRFSGPGAILTDMDSGDTATVTIQYSGATKIIDVSGANPNVATGFSGQLVC